jgi:hypothetical protein
MSSWTGDDDGDYLGPALWSQQDPEFNTNFPVLDKRDFKFMCDVRKYTPNQMVNWPRCVHGEFCVMQVYQRWNNFGRRFWHCLVVTSMGKKNSLPSTLHHYMIY